MPLTIRQHRELEAFMRESNDGTADTRIFIAGLVVLAVACIGAIAYWGLA